MQYRAFSGGSLGERPLQLDMVIPRSSRITCLEECVDIHLVGLADFQQCTIVAGPNKFRVIDSRQVAQHGCSVVRHAISSMESGPADLVDLIAIQRRISASISCTRCWRLPHDFSSFGATLIRPRYTVIPRLCFPRAMSASPNRASKSMRSSTSITLLMPQSEFTSTAQVWAYAFLAARYNEA
jgi:hypothetical protein